MKHTLKQAVEKYPVGTRVKWSREFLRNIAAYDKASADRTGTVMSAPYSCSPTHHIIKVRWDDEKPDAELNGCATSNLVALAKIHLEPA